MSTPNAPTPDAADEREALVKVAAEAIMRSMLANGGINPNTYTIWTDWRPEARAVLDAVADRLVAPLKARLAEVEAERDELLRGTRCPQCCATEWNGAAHQRRLAERAEAERNHLLATFFSTCPKTHEHGIWCGSDWVSLKARAERAEADLAAAEQRGGAVLAAAHDAADELDVWDGYPSATLDGCSPGGVVRHAVHEANGTDIDNCPACADRLATQANDEEE